MRTILPSVTSAAANTSAPAFVEATVNEAWPFASEVPEIVLMTGVPGPDFLLKNTVLPETGPLVAFCKVTVIVDVATLFASTEVGDATTVEVLAFATDPAKKLTVAVSVMTRFPSVTSVPVKTFVPGVVEVTVKTAFPPPSVVPEIVLITGLPGPDVLASDTVLPETGMPFESVSVTVIVE